MATFPMPQPDEAVHPPYTGITFTYVTTEGEKLVQQTETMIEQGLSRKYPKRLLPLMFPMEENKSTKPAPKGKEPVFIIYSSKQVRFIVKSFLALFVAQAELAEKQKKGGDDQPPRRGGDIQSV